MIVRDFLDWIEYYTTKESTTMMILRTTGPDAANTADKANSVYSAYYQNFLTESPELFYKLLYNEFTFVEFNSEEEAYDFAVDNLPMSIDAIADPDYFVEFVIFSEGNLVYSNHDISWMSDKIPNKDEIMTLEP